MKREELIAQLREALTGLTSDEKSMCQVAAERGIFCRGFRQYDDQELRNRYWWLVRKRPDLTRAELENLANEWQLSQQDVRDADIACDVQSKVHDTCNGWDGFTDEQLAAFYQQVTGKAAAN
jgi:hypothetical protein